MKRFTVVLNFHFRRVGQPAVSSSQVQTNVINALKYCIYYAYYARFSSRGKEQ